MKSITLTDSRNSEFKSTAIQNAYSQIPTLFVKGTDWEIPAWSVVKHIHHASDFKLDPT